MGKMATPAHAPTIETTPIDSTRRRVLWIGSGDGLEFVIARTGLAALADVVDAESPEAAVASGVAGLAGQSTPTLAVLAADRPARFSADDAVILSKAWPLMPIVSVASSLVDGRRRSGPPLPGIEEVPWHDLPGRCGWWLAALEKGVPTSLGLPATSRREERLLESIGGLQSHAGEATPGHPATLILAQGAVSVVAARADDLEGLCDLLTVAGHRVLGRQIGRPQIDESADTLVWDVGDLEAGDLEWLRLLAANRPGLFIVMLDSFPRGDSVAAALRAGAAAVLGRPVNLEALAGSLMRRRTLRSAQSDR
jgi:hypothetical protein